MRYVERNAKKAGLCNLAQDWRWSSIWRRENGSAEQALILAEWPVDMPKNYLELVNLDQRAQEEKYIDTAIEKGNPYGDSNWMAKVVKKFGLEQTLRGVGRPKK